VQPWIRKKEIDTLRLAHQRRRSAELAAICTQRNSAFTFTTAQLPEKAGIDPFALLIDRIPDDNVKNVTLESGPAQQTQI
jgi:hypothetical protein